MESTLGMIWKTMGITYLYKFHVYSNFSGPRLIRISYGSYILHSKKFDQYFLLHFHTWNLYGCTHKESFFAHIHSMENVWVRRSTLGMIWENYRDDLSITTLRFHKHTDIDVFQLNHNMNIVGLLESHNVEIQLTPKGKLRFPFVH